MTWLIGLLAPTVGEKFAKPLAILLLALLAIGLFFGAKAIYDHNVVSGYKTKVEASAAKADRKADQQAADRKELDQARQNAEYNELVKVQENAQNETQRRLAFHRCLRLQQQARDNGLKSPSCI